jgi:hypothetical protein
MKSKKTKLVFRGPMAAAVLAVLAGAGNEPKYEAQCARCKKLVKTSAPIAQGTVFYCSLDCAD